jgi:hypothetical protein
MWDEDGNYVYEPEKARRMWATPENIMVSLVDKGEDSYIRLSLGKSTEIGSVMGLDQTLRTASSKYNLLYQLRRNPKADIEPSHFATKASMTENKKEKNMDIFEAMHGTSKSSYWKLEEARMIVRHSAKINETVIGSRGRNIKAIYVENSQGERFMFPTRQLSPARAMTQHVNHGGKFTDKIGESIIHMAENYANLGKASGFINRNSSNLSESAMEIREKCRNQISEMRKCFERLARPGGYIGESKKLEDETETLNEDSEGNLEQLKELLIVEGSELDEDVIRSIAEAMVKSKTLNELDTSALDRRTNPIKDTKCPECSGKGDFNGRECPACAGSGIESIKVCGRYVSMDAWNDFKAGKLVLKGKVVLNNIMRFANKDDELSFKLGEIAERVNNDSMCNFLGYVSDALHNRNTPERLKSLRHVAAHALKIAGLSIDEGICSKNPAVKEFAYWLSGFSVDKILIERDDDEYSYDEHSPRKSEENINRAIDEAIGSVDIIEFLDRYKSDFGWDDETLTGSDLAYEKKYIMHLLSHYLSKKVEEESGFEDVDMDLYAEEFWPKVKDHLSGRGYSITEGDFSREDVLIPTNQGDDLKREVEPSTMIDVITGREVPVDSGSVNRARGQVAAPWYR